jgi:acetolactate synthase-1/2/3 large subunit
MRPHVKLAAAVRRVADLAPVLEDAFETARRGVPGPTFVECPVDLLYPESTVRGWYARETGGSGGVSARAAAWYATRHLDHLFAERAPLPRRRSGLQWEITVSAVTTRLVARAADLLRRAERPVVVVGSQALSRPHLAPAVADAVGTLGAPVFLAGMARGLLGRDHRLQLRRGRKEALREADVVLLAGVPCDFRLDYGCHIGRRAKVIAVDASLREAFMNRWPSLPVIAHPGEVLVALARSVSCDAGRVEPWLKALRARDRSHGASCLSSCERVDPIRLCGAIDAAMDPRRSIVVVDGGDFVATASYIVRPAGPLSWLDPGVFGTLGVGAGFALGAVISRPDAEVWLLYGDGSLGYSLVELDTFRRHGLPVIAVVGNDGSWGQIARDQVSILGDDVATVLERSEYHEAARGLGAEGLVIESDEQVVPVLERAKALARRGRPVLVNVLLATTDARSGSVSI